jgi:uncharacterized membrane protein YjjB (DUF3815 family)
MIGVAGALLARRSRAPTAIWTVPAILPLLPAPATLLPLLAETYQEREALQGQALGTAFAIGVGVASGSIAEAISAQPGRRSCCGGSHLDSARAPAV